MTDSVLHVAYCIVDRDDISQFEECSLQNGVRSSCAQTDLLGDGYSVTGVELYIVVGNVTFYLCRKMLFQLLVAPYAVQEEESARFYILYHFVTIQICAVVAGNEVSLFYIVSRFDRGISET